MYYIKQRAFDNGNYGNPTTICLDGMVALPAELVESYIETKGFAILTIESGTVVGVEVNQEALDAYEESLPIPVPEPEPMTQEEIEEILLDQEYRLLLLEYGLEEEL